VGKHQLDVTYKWPDQACQIESLALGLLRQHLPSWNWRVEGHFLKGVSTTLDNTISLWLSVNGTWGGCLGRRFMNSDVARTSGNSPEHALAAAGMLEGLARMRHSVHEAYRRGQGTWVSVQEDDD
jgi:hypothetical protein